MACLLMLKSKLQDDKKLKNFLTSTASVGGFLGVCFLSAAILVAFEGPVELANRQAAVTSWQNAMATQSELVAMLSRELAGRPDALSNLTALSNSLLEHLGPKPLLEEADAIWCWTYPGAIYFVFTIVTTIGCAQIRF